MRIRIPSFHATSGQKENLVVAVPKDAYVIQHDPPILISSYSHCSWMFEALEETSLVLGSLLVDVGGGVVLLLVDLVA